MTGHRRGSMVDVRNVRKVYKRDVEELVVLNGINLAVPAGEFVALMGPSGSGKTTLLNLIAGIDRPTPARSPSPATTSPSCRETDARALAHPQHRLHLPALQPDPGADRASRTSSCRCC